MRKIVLLIFSVAFFGACKKESQPAEVIPPVLDTAIIAKKIYFSGYNEDTAAIFWGEVFSCNLDGSNQQRISNNSNNFSLAIHTSDIVFSYDSTKLFVSSNRDNPNFDLFKMDLDGSNMVKIVCPAIPNSDNTTSTVFFQNDQKKVFRKWTAAVNYTQEIWTSNLDGSNTQKITDPVLDGRCGYPFVDKIHNKILYTSYSGNNAPEIYSMNFDGTNKLKISNDPAIFRKSMPAISPDGTKIVFEGAQMPDTADYVQDLFIMNIDGTNIRKITDVYNMLPGRRGVVDGHTFISNNQLLLTIEFDYPHAAQLYSVYLDGTGITPITNTVENKFTAIVKW